MNRKKIRGIKRKCQSMVEQMHLITKDFPAEEPDYWQVYLPVSRAFITSVKTPRSVKRLCLQTLIDRVQHLIEIKPQLNVPTRVIAAIDLQNLWGSQIFIFFGEEYYRRFFKRNLGYQKWIILPTSRDIQKEWRLSIPIDLKIQGFKEEINGGDVSYVGELWFVGELERVIKPVDV